MQTKGLKGIAIAAFIGATMLSVSRPAVTFAADAPEARRPLVICGRGLRDDSFNLVIYPTNLFKEFGGSADAFGWTTIGPYHVVTVVCARGVELVAAHKDIACIGNETPEGPVYAFTLKATPNGGYLYQPIEGHDCYVNNN